MIDIESKLLNCIVQFNRLNQVFLRMTKGSVSKLTDIKQNINLEIRISEQN